MWSRKSDPLTVKKNKIKTIILEHYKNREDADAMDTSVVTERQNNSDSINADKINYRSNSNKFIKGINSKQTDIDINAYIDTTIGKEDAQLKTEINAGLGRKVSNDGGNMSYMRRKRKSSNRNKRRRSASAIRKKKTKRRRTRKRMLL